MEAITIENIEKEIEKEIEKLLECAPMSYCNLERLNVLCESMKHLSRMHREFTEANAKAWVASMNPPAKWTMEQTTDQMNKRGYCHTPCEFWAVMNALYSDYGKTMAKFGADKPEVYADLAHDWLDDTDAEDDKVGRYWRDVVKH